MCRLLPLIFASILATACGGAGEPEAEATWETHTTDAEGDTAGGEESD